ncbi:MAG: GDSL-type esterase/lipase family protein [Oscillospiraceae bacterium]
MDEKSKDNNQEYAQKKRRRRVKKTVRRVLVLFVALVVILGMAWGITELIQGGEAAVPVESMPEVPQAAVSLPQEVPQPEAEPPPMPEVDNTQWNFIGPVEQEPETMQLITPDYRMIALPENGRVDMRYFDTVTFVGDSITQGMYLWGIKNAHYCTYKSIGPKGVYDGSVWQNVNGTSEIPMEALVASQPDNVYILLGPNAMVAYRDDEILVAYFEEMIDAMKENLDEGVGIYLQSITPVLPNNQPGFTIERIQRLNDMLAQLAWEKDIYFVDLHEALAQEDGWLRPEYGSAKDGYHMTATGVKAWVEYLVTHTAYHPRNPYLEGSHYYTQQPSA